MCVCCELDVGPLALLGQSGDHQEVQSKDISGRCVWWFCGEEQGRAEGVYWMLYLVEDHI